MPTDAPYTLSTVNLSLQILKTRKLQTFSYFPCIDPLNLQSYYQIAVEAVEPGEDKGPWDLSPASPVLSLPAIFWFSLQSSTKGLLSAVHTARWQSALTQLRKGCVEELITSACCCSYVNRDLTLLDSAAVFSLAVQSPVSLECGVLWRDNGKGLRQDWVPCE